MRPPPPLLLAYRLFGWRLGPEHREWTYGDITRRGYVLRQALPLGLGLGAVLAVVFAATGSDPRRAIVPLIGVLVLAVALRKALRDRALQQQGLNAAGEPVAAWWSDDAERHRLNVNGAVLLGALVAAGLVLLVVRRD